MCAYMVLCDKISEDMGLIFDRVVWLLTIYRQVLTSYSCSDPVFMFSHSHNP